MEFPNGTKLVTDKLYHKMSDVLRTAAQPLTKEEQESQLHQHIREAAMGILNTPFCKVDPATIKVEQNGDSTTADITYSLTMPQLKDTATLTFSAENPIIKYLSRCETCKTASGKLKLRWFWKSGVVTDFSKHSAAPDEAHTITDVELPQAAPTPAEGVQLVDAIVQLDAEEDRFLLLRGVLPSDKRIVDTDYGAVIMTHNELSNLPDETFAKIPNPAPKGVAFNVILEAVAKMARDNGNVENKEDVENTALVNRVGGKVTNIGSDPTYKHGMPCHDHSFNNSFALFPKLLPEHIKWNPLLDNVYADALEHVSSAEDKLVLAALDSAVNKVISGTTTPTKKTKKHSEHSEESLSALRKRMLSEHLDTYVEHADADAGTKAEKKHNNHHKHLSKSEKRALREQHLQERITAAIEYTDSFTENPRVDVESGIRYRLERVQRQLKAEAQDRIEAGEEELPRSSSRYYNAVIKELTRQLEQCERFNIFADTAKAAHDLAKLAQA